MSDFISVVWRIYDNDPNWVGPLNLERRQAYSSSHPFFLHADWQPFVAYLEDVPVGRISAQIDYLFQKEHSSSAGFFGCFEAVENQDVIDALFEATEDWLIERGCDSVLGPFNLGINQELGLLVDGFDTPPTFMMGHGRITYEDHIKRLGYAEVKRMYAYELPVVFSTPPVMQSVLNRVRQRVTMRPLNRKKLKSELELIRELFNDAWASNWKFVPWTKEEFFSVGKEIMLLIPDDFVQIAELEGEPVAFIIIMPDLNEVIRDLAGKIFPIGWVKLLWRLKVRYPQHGRVPLMGVKKAHQKGRFGAGLALLCIDALRNPSHNKGIRQVELSWILEDNKGMRNIIDSIGGKISKTYAMYERQLKL
tara:strand:+ start:1238 stop:2329 length:1092 start_codon:yes stop_codon:yes gene_type:complete